MRARSQGQESRAQRHGTPIVPPHVHVAEELPACCPQRSSWHAARAARSRSTAARRRSTQAASNACAGRRRRRVVGSDVAGVIKRLARRGRPVATRSLFWRRRPQCSKHPWALRWSMLSHFSIRRGYRAELGERARRCRPWRRTRCSLSRVHAGTCLEFLSISSACRIWR